jgi:hypothetical protein
MDFSFKKPALSEWLQKAEKDLRGKKSIEELHYQVDNLTFSSFITENEALKPHPIVRPAALSAVLCAEGDTQLKNKNALKALECGVRSVAWVISDSDSPEVLFKDIFLDMIDILCYVDHPSGAIKMKQAADRGYYGQPVRIHTIDRSDRGQYTRLDHNMTFTERIHHFKISLRERQTTQQIFYADVDLKKEFLPQIAELRALRRIWEKENQTAELVITAHIPLDYFKNTEVHPLIICNYLIMSGKMGMADYVMSLPFDENDELARLSLNIQHILDEESRFSEVSDPAAGSYIVEEMTETFARL